MSVFSRQIKGAQDRATYTDDERPDKAHIKTRSGLNKRIWVAGQVGIFVGGIYLMLARITLQMWRPTNLHIYRAYWWLVIFTYGVSLHQMIGSRIPDFFSLLPVDTFQYIMLAFLWSFSRVHAEKVFPFTLYAFLHVMDQLTTKASKSGRTKARLQDQADKYGYRAGRVVGFFNLFLFVPLLLDVVLIRPAALISILAYALFYRIRLLYSPLDQDTMESAFRRSDQYLGGEKSPQVVRERWLRLKARIENYSSVSKQVRSHRGEEEDAIKKANREVHH